MYHTARVLPRTTTSTIHSNNPPKMGIGEIKTIKWERERRIRQREGGRGERGGEGGREEGRERKGGRGKREGGRKRRERGREGVSEREGEGGREGGREGERERERRHTYMYTFGATCYNGIEYSNN